MRAAFPLEPGRVVLSEAGRDRGRLMVVLALPDEDCALVADGTLRKVSKPKRKKRKHLRATQASFPDLAEKLASGAAVMDHELRERLRAIEAHEEG